MKKIIIIIVILSAIFAAPIGAMWFNDSVKDLTENHQNIMEKYR